MNQPVGEELQRIDRMLSDASDSVGVTVGPHIAFESTSARQVILQVLRLLRELDVAIDSKRALNSVKLPEWLKFGAPLEGEALEQWLETWRNETFDAGPPAPALQWDKENWLYWFEPANKFWSIVGYSVTPSVGRIFLMFDTEIVPTDALQHLVSCAGGASVGTYV